MASTLEAMASTVEAMAGLQPKSNGLQTKKHPPTPHLLPKTKFHSGDLRGYAAGPRAAQARERHAAAQAGRGGAAAVWATALGDGERPGRAADGECVCFECQKCWKHDLHRRAHEQAQTLRATPLPGFAVRLHANLEASPQVVPGQIH